MARRCFTRGTGLSPGRFRAALPVGLLAFLPGGFQAAEPYLVKDLNTTPTSSTPHNLTVVGDRIFFTADDALHGEELWVTDGTPEGTVLFKDLNPGPEGSMPGLLATLGERIFFSAYDRGHMDLWVSDGTPAGTRLLREIAPGLALPCILFR